MKLIIIQPRVSYYTGGGESIPMDMIKSLTQDGKYFEKISLLTTKPSANYSEHFIKFKNLMVNVPEFEVIEIPVPEKFRSIYDINPGQDRSRWDRESLMFLRMISETKLDLSEYSHAISFYILDGLCVSANVVNILYLLGYPKDTNTLRSSLLNSYDILIANSQSVINNWEKDMTQKQFKSTHMLMQGLVMEELDEEKIFAYNKKVKNIVFVGRLIERKGIIDLMEAIEILVRKGINIVLHIYGEGVLKQKIVNKIAELNLSDRVILYGNKSDIPYRLINADICCFPSHAKEGLMSTVLEGMYYNGTVITTTKNGSESVITDYDSGFLVAPNNIQTLANKIEEVINLDNSTINKIKSNARKSIEEKCSWKSFSENFRKII